MKIAILTFHDSLYLPLAQLSLPNKKKYVQKNSYGLFVKEDGFGNHFGWEKIRSFIELIKRNEYDWIFWLGADAIITNFNIKLESIIDNNFHFIMATDSHGINSDSMLVRCSPESLAFFEEMILPKPEYLNHVEFEQGVMRDLFHSSFPHLVKYVSQKTMNSYLYDYYIHMDEYKERKDKFGNPGDWTEGDFVIHFPGITLYEKFKNCIIYVEKVIL